VPTTAPNGTRSARTNAADGFDAAALAELRRRLLRWYRAHGRDLPWRRSHDPFAVWVSEIMLQQTTVSAVIPYFERFLARFPDVASLAAASEHEVLRLWEGLGYYRRARHLHAAARQVVADGGRIPCELSQLARLPGVGRSTAGAIASLAFGRPAPILEANTRRVYARLAGCREDLHATKGRDALWAFAERAIPRRGAGEFNQALMDLGATVCRPADPDCGRCPVRTCCRACAEGIQSRIASVRKRPEPTRLTEAMVAVRRAGRYLLRRASRDERWAGLWEFVRVRLEERGNGASLIRIPPPGGMAELPLGQDLRARRNSTARRTTETVVPPRPRESRRIAARSSANARPNAAASAAGASGQIERLVFEKTGLDIELADRVLEFRHTVTRFRIRLICVVAEPRGGRLDSSQEFRWARPDEFATFAFSRPARRFAQMLAAST
jgi:A/G-specific adenine glycosylase